MGIIKEFLKTNTIEEAEIKFTHETRYVFSLDELTALCKKVAWEAYCMGINEATPKNQRVIHVSGLYERLKDWFNERILDSKEPEL
jgi:hypothetical protein